MVRSFEDKIGRCGKQAFGTCAASQSGSRRSPGGAAHQDVRRAVANHQGGARFNAEPAQRAQHAVRVRLDAINIIAPDAYLNKRSQPGDVELTLTGAARLQRYNGDARIAAA